MRRRGIGQRKLSQQVVGKLGFFSHLRICTEFGRSRHVSVPADMDGRPLYRLSTGNALHRSGDPVSITTGDFNPSTSSNSPSECPTSGAELRTSGPTLQFLPSGWVFWYNEESRLVSAHLFSGIAFGVWRWSHGVNKGYPRTKV